ncbi:MAG: leucine-rich repeat domain-containing protein [Wenyingzhuangia sp.]|uniref:leucine-rich repeat domain-containing protein n=1 Tax=Wenyingzhuangia sp. TaxID=1964193 RepID=UPI00321B8A14
MMRNLEILMIALFTIGITYAQTFDTVEGIAYTVTDSSAQTVAITDYSGTTTDIAISATIENQGITYAVTSIGDYAFQFSNLTSVSFPNSITSIGSSSFNSNSLTSLTLPDSVTSIGQTAFAFNAIQSITFPSHLEIIDSFVFQDNLLTSIDIPEGITTVKYSAFKNNKLASVTIPSTIERIGDLVFHNNEELAIVTIASLTPFALGDAFQNKENIDLVIPKGVSGAYEDAQWTGFKTVTEDVNLDTKMISKEVLQLKISNTKLSVVTSASNVEQISVMSVIGQSVADGLGSSVKISHLPSGIYIALLKTTNGIVSRKFIK